MSVKKMTTIRLVMSSMFEQDIENAWAEYDRTGKKNLLVQGVRAALCDQQYYQIRMEDNTKTECSRLFAEYTAEVNKRAEFRHKPKRGYKPEPPF